ncbi:hypothetical protein Gpo141_00007161 [Globisporangium polare]
MQFAPTSRPSASVGMSAVAAAHTEDGDAAIGPQAARSKRLERTTVAGSSNVPFFTPSSLRGDRPNVSSQSSVVQPHPYGDRGGVADAASLNSRTQALERLLCAPGSNCHLQIAQLQDEKEFLTKYVERILNQLRVVLQKHGELEKLKALTDPQVLAEQYERMAAENAEDGDLGGESGLAKNTDRLAPWITSQEYTNPLLQAYDLKIYELERSVDENKKAMDRIVARAGSLAKENTSLRQEMEAESEKTMLRAQHEPKELPFGNDDFSMVHENGEYLGEINERIDVLMSENNMLMEQVSLQDDELSAMRKELQDRDQQLQIMGQNFNQATLALQELRDSCESIRDEKARCESQLQQYAARIAHLESHKEGLVQQTEVLQAERRNLESQMAEYESLLNTVKKNTERKDETFSNRYQNVCARLRELNSVIEHKERAIDELEERNRTLQADLDSARQDCEGMLNVLNSMEKQLTQYCNREDSVTEVHKSDCSIRSYVDNY